VTARTRLRFGFSPCPNDTFAFHAAVAGTVPGGVPLEPVLADIESLNERAVADADPLPVTKLSIPALARTVDRHVALDAGAALGFGCGPLVVCRATSALRSLDDLANARVAIPGRRTTAFLLLSTLLRRPPADCTSMSFDRVMPAVAAGEFDAGLVIHESRFTYRDHGLRELADLGVVWEQVTGGPLPLAVIAARRDLGEPVLDALTTTLRESVRQARRDPSPSRSFVRAHAQELSEDVCARHIALYVNDFSEQLGEVGRRAIHEMLARGRDAGLLPAGPSPFREGR